MKPHKNIGLHPTNALKIALKLFDNKQTTKEKISLLLNNRSVSNLESVDTPKDFASGKTIDINAGELLGIGSVAAYYNWMSEEAGTGNTYQAVVGIEDAGKNQIESQLSDGAIYHDQVNGKILAQQVMTQGYYPDKWITSQDVIDAVKKKCAERHKYHENCILIVNVFGDKVNVDRKVIYDEISKLSEPFSDTYMVVYGLPSLKMAHVSFISEPPDTRGLALKLERHEYEDIWHFNKMD
ncbi:hypothetical protein RAAC3_TM7C00001G0154 [Candidatus Saccharibacteria bacterium RAAC3_TM7_1]|nr:hypothetical protein RAAC3_TM7C00001G0154 [Candidatus Saccharibacteria bacterium RAAC3_TM7_1]